jgi:selenocysteine lyase/cysteine desulfurase
MTRPIVTGPALDVDRLRAETPGCAHVIHLNNAGAALMPAPVLEAVQSHLRLEGEIGGYEAFDAALDKHARVYESFATLLGARSDEIALVENATRAFDMGFHALPLRAGDTVLVSVADYGSNYLAGLRRGLESGIRLEVVPNDECGQISLTALADMLSEPSVRAVSLTHVPTNSGLVQPAAEVGRLARTAGVWFILDATQSAGQMPLDVDSLGCDLLVGTGRKYLRGPRGTGFLYVRSSRLEELHPPFVDIHAARWSSRDSYTLRSDARRFENWESNVAGVLGVGAAVNYALGLGIENTWPRIQSLAARLRNGLSAIRGAECQDPGAEMCGICSFVLPGRDAEEVKAELAAMHPRINVTVTSPESTLIDTEVRKLGPALRASVHYYNTEREIDRFLMIVADLAGS